MSGRVVAFAHVAKAILAANVPDPSRKAVVVTRTRNAAWAGAVVRPAAPSDVSNGAVVLAVAP